MASSLASAHIRCSLPVVGNRDVGEGSKHKALVEAGSLSSGDFAADTSLDLLERGRDTSSVGRGGLAENSGASSWLHHDQDLSIHLTVGRHDWDWESTSASVDCSFVEFPYRVHLTAVAS